MAELCPETAISGRDKTVDGGLCRNPKEIEAFGIPICNTRCYTCPSDVAIAHLTFQFTTDSLTSWLACIRKANMV